MHIDPKLYTLCPPWVVEPTTLPRPLKVNLDGMPF